MGLGRLIGTVVGGIISFCSGYGLYKIAEIILNGASKGEWLMVIAGGVLAYVFAGLLVVGFFAGLAIIFLSLFD